MSAVIGLTQEKDEYHYATCREKIQRFTWQSTF
jgi:hypothetical protein